jgi:hypothetical protein
VDLELVRTLEELGHDLRRPVGREDEVDHRAAVVVEGLEEPALRRPLGAVAGARKEVEGMLGVIRAHEEVDVMLGGRPSARIDREPARQRERHLVVAQHRGGTLHRLQELGEGIVVCHGTSGYPRMLVPVLG